MQYLHASACDITGQCMQYVHALACGAMGQSHGLLHALTAWDLKFQVCLGYTFTPATLHYFAFKPQTWWVFYTPFVGTKINVTVEFPNVILGIFILCLCIGT